MKHIKSIATLLLVIAMVGVLIGWFFRDNFFGALLFAACEAAMVGALADWFAVSALFRHPLGLKFIPHTAIIPNNREKIIEGIASMVEDDWLSKEFLNNKIAEYPLTERLLTFLSTDEGRSNLQQAIEKAIVMITSEMQDETKANLPDLVRKLEGFIKDRYSEAIIIFLLEGLDGLVVSPDFAKLVKTAVKKSIADYAAHGNFWRRLSKDLGETLAIIDYDDATQVLVGNMRQLLSDMKNQDNPNYQRLLEIFQGLQIDQDKLLAMIADQSNEDSPTQEKMAAYLTNFVVDQVTCWQQDKEHCQQIDAYLKKEARHLLDRYHNLIGKMVREKLVGLDNVALVDSLEDKVGNDLQWIRINGTIIGALIGIAQYLVRFYLL